MHVSLWLAAAVLLLAATPTCALTAEQAVARHIEARGGLERIQAISTLKLEGKLRVADQGDLAFVVYKQAPDLARTETTLQGLTQVQAWDGHNAWRIAPFQGRHQPEKISGDDAKAFARDASLAGPLVDWRARDGKLDYLGMQDLDGTPTHKLKLTQKNGDVEYVYLDVAHYLAIRTVAEQMVHGVRVETISDYADFERVDGVYFPFSITSWTTGTAPSDRRQITLTRAVTNVPMDDRLFTYPAAPAAPSLAAGVPR